MAFMKNKNPDHYKDKVGSPKVTAPGPKISSMPTVDNKYSLLRDSKRAEAKFNRGAARPWIPKGRAKVVSKGSSDIPGAKPKSRKTTVRVDASEA